MHRALPSPENSDNFRAMVEEKTGCLEPDWTEDCLRERHRRLTGKFCHWCPDWDGLTIDETCPGWPCACAPGLKGTVTTAEEVDARIDDL